MLRFRALIMLRIILVFFILSSTVFADSYTPVQVGRYSIYLGGILYYGPAETLCPPATMPSPDPQYNYVFRPASYCDLIRKDTGVTSATYSMAFVMWEKTCPYGGTYQSSINKCVDDTCVAPKVRNATTHICEEPLICPDGSTQTALTPCPIVCNSTPSVTTLGPVQTVQWGTLQDVGSSNPICVNNSFSCTAPMVANVEMKRCDLTCPDGSVVNVSGGAQCPPPTCVGGQTLNTATNTCDDPVCTILQYYDASTHTCLTTPNCVGQQTLNTSSIPYVCADPVCTGLKLLNTTTHICEDPAPAQCVGGQTLNTATNTCTDPVCPSGYHLNAGKICENDGECPLFTTKTMVDGVLKCATTSTGTSSTTTGQGSVITTTTRNNPDGTTTTTRAGKTSTTDCPDCAKESTLREVVKKLDATKGGSTAGQGADGLWYEPTDKTYQSILQTGMTGIQNTPIMSFGKDLFNVTLPTGSCPTWTVPAVMGMSSFDIAPLCSDAMDMAWPIVAGALKILAVFLAFRIAMSGLN